MGAKLGGLFDQYWPTLIGIVGALMMALAPVFFDEDGVFFIGGFEVRQVDALITLILLGGILAGVGSFLLGAAIRSNAQIVTQTKAAERAASTVLYNAILVPLLDRMGNVLIATESTIDGRYYKLLTKACGDASGFLGDDQNTVTVNYYRLLGPVGGEYLEVVEETSQVDRPKLDRTSVAGRMILDRTLDGKGEYAADLLGEDASRTDLAKPRKYRCFASVAVVTEGTVYGMLSANTPLPAGMDASSQEFLRVIASVLAIAERKLGVAQGRKIPT